MHKCIVHYSINKIDHLSCVIKNAISKVQEAVILDSMKAFELRLVFSELLVNALIHGNKSNPQKKAHLLIGIKEEKHNEITFAVCDEGDGFGHRHLRCHSAIITDVDALNGRGVDLVRQFADRIRYNKKGNKVLVHMKLEGKGCKKVKGAETLEENAVCK